MRSRWWGGGAVGRARAGCGGDLGCEGGAKVTTQTPGYAAAAQRGGSGSAAMAAAAAGAGWELPWWVTAAALAAAAEVVAATACWLALCRLAAWRRRGQGRHPPPFSVPVGEEEESPADVEMNH
jgi:hypothetical protein